MSVTLGRQSVIPSTNCRWVIQFELDKVLVENGTV